MKIYTNNSLSIGNTPIVMLKRRAKENAAILVKLENRNPTASIKARVAANMVLAAEKNGRLKPGMKIIEPTSGNTGIGLAFVGAAKGYNVSLIMPENMSIERRKILKALGADLILTNASEGMNGAISKANKLAQSNPEHFFLPQQFKNPANPAVHRHTTGPEIWNATNGRIDALVTGVGTGGTLTGLAQFLKHDHQSNAVIVAVEPQSSPVISQTIAGIPLTPAPHKIQGIGAGFIPEILNISLIDRTIQISDEAAFSAARDLALQDGIMAGISSGAAVAAARSLAEEPEFSGKTIVTILPDSGERYLSTTLYDI